MNLSSKGHVRFSEFGLAAPYCGLVVCVVPRSWTNMPVWLLDSWDLLMVLRTTLKFLGKDEAETIRKSCNSSNCGHVIMHHILHTLNKLTVEEDNAAL